MESMNEARLAEIEKRAEAATPGPWHHFDDCGACNQNETFGHEICSSEGEHGDGCPDPMVHCHICIDRGGVLEVTNATFIAAARQDVSDLVAEVRRLRKALTRISSFTNQYGQSDEAEIASEALDD